MTSRSTHLRGILLAGGGMLLISPDGLLFRLMSASDLQILFWRGLAGFLTLSIYIQLTDADGLIGAVRRCRWAGLACTVLMTAGTIFFISSITRTTVANTLVILSAVPLFGAILGWAILRQRVERRTWLAIAACIGGIVLIFSGSIGGGSALDGDLFALCGALCMASNLTVIRANKHISLLPALALSGLLTALVVFPFIDPLAVDPRDLGIMIFMGIAFQALAFGLFLAAGRHLPPAEVGLFALVETVLGPFWTWVGVGETPTANALIGGAIVVLTLALHSFIGLRRPAPTPAAQRAD